MLHKIRVCGAWVQRVSLHECANIDYIYYGSEEAVLCLAYFKPLTQNCSQVVKTLDFMELKIHFQFTTARHVIVS
jgi:hypothetical protein